MPKGVKASQGPAWHYAYYQTPSLGRLILAADGQHIVGSWFEGQKYFGLPYRDQVGVDSLSVASASSDAVLVQTSRWLDDYFVGEQPAPDKLPLRPQGTDFQRRVWHELLQIHYGKTTTYGQIAFKLAQQTGKLAMSAQAIGGAVAHNPLSIIIPCHRVIAADGSLTGYAGGIERKQWLLAHEGAALEPII